MGRIADCGLSLIDFDGLLHHHAAFKHGSHVHYVSSDPFCMPSVPVTLHPPGFLHYERLVIAVPL
jgi:hypothetical protein